MLLYTHVSTWDIVYQHVYVMNKVQCQHGYLLYKYNKFLIAMAFVCLLLEYMNRW